MCPHLECWAQFQSLHVKNKIVELENAQRRIAKMIDTREQSFCKERLKMQGPIRLKAKRLRGYIIEMYVGI